MPKRIVRGFTAATAGRAVVFALVYLAAAELGHLLTLKGGGLPFATFWPPAGLLLAALTLSPRRAWPAFLLAGGVANLVSDVLLHETSLAVSLAFCVVNALEACLGAWLLHRFVGLPLTLERPVEVLGIAGLSGVGILLGATLGAAITTWANGVGYGRAWQMWWFADTIGVILIAPVVFAWAAGPASFATCRPRRIAEAGLLFVGAALATECVYGELLPLKFGAPAFVLPFLFWAVLRFSQRIVTIAVLVAAVIAVWNTSQGLGPYFLASTPALETTLRAQTVVAVANLCILLMAAAIAERKRLDQERIATVARLEQALAEIKLLRELIPMCAWCNRIQDDAHDWQKIETYLRTRMHTDVTHGICPECLEARFGTTASLDQRAG